MGRAKIINYDNNTKENMSQYNRKWSQIANHPYRILIIGGLKKRINKYDKNKNMMMIIVLLIKLIYILRIQMKLNINILLKNLEKIASKI